MPRTQPFGSANQQHHIDAGIPCLQAWEDVNILVTTRQYVRFSAPEGMDVETAKDWFVEHRDDDGVVVVEGSEDVADEELYMDGE